MSEDPGSFDAFEPEEDRLFNLQEAEELIPRLTVWLTEAMTHRHRILDIEKELVEVQSRILLRGGIIPPHARLAERNLERERYVEPLREVLDQITGTGCLIKDLDHGLIDFPSIVEDEQALLCWKLGEERIRYWHRADEGFAGRKLLSDAEEGSSGDTRPN